jgi:hypothetical protein
MGIPGRFHEQQQNARIQAHLSWALRFLGDKARSLMFSA